MKRWLSLLLTMALLMSVCMPTIHATPIEELCYVKPTNARWSDDGTMLWESDYFTNSPDNFHGFQLVIRYSTDDVGSVESPDWEYLYSYQTYLQYPSMGDFALPVSGWYSFQVRAYGENMSGENGWAYEYVSEMSDWSEAKYFETADRLPMPTDLHWEGTTMCWTVEDTTYVRGCQVYVCYLKDGQEELATSEWVTPQYRQTDFALSLEEMGLDEGWLVKYGTQSYYFKVMSMSKDYTKAADSAWAVCTERMDFNAAAKKLETPVGLYWDNYTMKWNAVEGVSYDVKLWFQRTELTPEEEDEWGIAGGSSEEIFIPREIKEYSGITGDDDWPVLDNSVIENYKGNYWFQVRSRSTDLSKNLSSDWSEESDELSVDGRFQLNAPICITWNSDDTLSWTWEAPAAQQAVLDGFYVQVYYKADLSDEAEYVGGVSVSGNTTSTNEWKNYANKDGYYSARVYAKSSDNDAFENSEMSDLGTDWLYDAPDPLASPTNLTWVGSRATWTTVGDVGDVSRYMVSLYYYGTDGSSEQVFCSSQSVNVDDPQVLFTEDNFTRNGEGVYRFGVYATTADPEQASDSLEVMSEPFTYTIPGTSLAAPTGMYWDKNYMKWDIPADTTGIGGYEVNYFGDNYSRDYNTTVEVGQFPILGDWDLEQLGDNIGFKVRALSDNVSANKNSPWATCTTNYVPPEGLPTPTNIAWNGSTMTWSWDGDSSLLANFIVELYYAANENTEPVRLIGLGIGGNSMEMYRWGQYATNPGLYFFTITARSRDTMVIANSKQSEMSSGYQYIPADPLPAPTGMKWDGSEIVWTIPEDEILEYIDYYEIDLYKEGQTYNIHRGAASASSGRYHVPTDVFENYGTGTYTFSIRAVSWDPSRYSNTGFVSSGSNFAFTGFKSDLPAPKNLRWEGNTAKWDAPEYGTVNSYDVRFTGSLRSIDYTVAAGRFITLSSYDVNRLGDNIKFQVRALSGNVNEYGDGNWAFCETPLEFEIEKMATPTDLAWNNGAMTWKWEAGSDLQADYRDVFSVEVYYGATADAEPKLLGARGVWGSNYTAWTQLAQDDGWYYFRVNTCSYNNNLVLSSDWSEMSKGYYFELPEPVQPATGVHWENSTVVWTASESGHDMARQYRVELYHISSDGTETKVAARYETNTQDLTTLRHIIPTSLFAEMGTGTYKVAVIAQALDPLAYRNSEPAWSGEYIYTNPGKALDAPTNLRWEGATAKWDVPADTSAIGYYEVVFFEAAYPDNSFKQDVAPGQFAEVDSWYLMMLGDTIGFCVRAASNDANTANDSAWATCATDFVYNPENVQPLPAPKNLKYDSKTGQLTWDVVENADEYTVKVWFTGVDAENEVLYDDPYYVDGQDANVFFHPNVEGTYKFAVQATSLSVVYSESKWVEYLYQLKPVKNVSNELKEAIASSDTVSEAVTAVREMDIKDLAHAMTAPADQETNTVVAQIKELEDKLQQTVSSEVSVNDAVEDIFPKDTVEVVGAALNADSGTVTLSIQEKSKDMPQVSEESYVNTVSFSMHLEEAGGEVIGELDVPVWIKLPVPKGMNPSLLWILHYHDDNADPQIIEPTMSEEGGQWYASFAVTSFSDFAMATKKPQIFLSENNGVWTAMPDPYYAPKQGGICIWSVYDDDGRMIGVTTGTDENPINCDGKPAFAKLFIVDGESYQATCLETPCILEMR